MDQESFVRVSPTPTLIMFFFCFLFFSFSFLVDEGKEGPNITKRGPSSAHQQNAICMAFHWWADNCPKLNAGLVSL